VLRRPDAVRALARHIGGDRYAEASAPRAMAEAVAAFDLAEDDLLCVVAGDGTLHAVLTALERQRPQGPWPRIAAAPGGTTNMTARDLGAAGGLVPWLRALRRWASSGATPAGAEPGGRFVTRPVLRIAVPGSEPLAGLFFGAGTVSAGVDFFNRRLRPLGIPERVGSPIAIVRTLLAMAMGGSGLDRMSPSMRVRVDGGPELDGPAVLLAVSTLRRVIIGARPFWGRGEGPIHLTLVKRSAKAIFRSVPRVALGRPGNRLTPERGWHSHDTARLELTFDGPYIVDGELYHAHAADGPLEVTAEREVRWWVP
jgi:hypothetical protein